MSAPCPRCRAASRRLMLGLLALPAALGVGSILAILLLRDRVPMTTLVIGVSLLFAGFSVYLLARLRAVASGATGAAAACPACEGRGPG